MTSEENRLMTLVFSLVNKSLLTFKNYIQNEMVITCLAPGCSARKDSINAKTSVQFHRFPLRKPDLLAKWVKAMKNPNFKPTAKSYLCSAHFSAGDYEVKPNNAGKHLKPNAVPIVFEKKKPGRKKKLLSENEVAGEIENEEENVSKTENDDVVEEEYLEPNNSDKEEPNLAEIIGSQEKETLQILIVGEDGKITNSEYIFKKQLFSDEDKQDSSVVGGDEMRDQGTDDEAGNQSSKDMEGQIKHSGSSEISMLNYKDLRNQEKIKHLEMELISTRKKVKVLQLKCKKMNKKLNRLKILLKLLVLKKGKGEKNLKQLLEECEKDLEDVKVKVKEEESDF